MGSTRARAGTHMPRPAVAVHAKVCTWQCACWHQWQCQFEVADCGHWQFNGPMMPLMAPSACRGGPAVAAKQDASAEQAPPAHDSHDTWSLAALARSRPRAGAAPPAHLTPPPPSSSRPRAAHGVPPTALLVPAGALVLPLPPNVPSCMLKPACARRSVCSSCFSCRTCPSCPPTAGAPTLCFPLGCAPMPRRSCSASHIARPPPRLPPIASRPPSPASRLPPSAPRLPPLAMPLPPMTICMATGNSSHALALAHCSRPLRAPASCLPPPTVYLPPSAPSLPGSHFSPPHFPPPRF